MNNESEYYIWFSIQSDAEFSINHDIITCIGLNNLMVRLKS